MVKRDDNPLAPNNEHVRDTVRQPVLPCPDTASQETEDVHEGRYKPEMGTFVFNDERNTPDKA
jgi:hypothetical protein